MEEVLVLLELQCYITEGRVEKLRNQIKTDELNALTLQIAPHASILQQTYGHDGLVRLVRTGEKKVRQSVRVKAAEHDGILERNAQRPANFQTDRPDGPG